MTITQNSGAIDASGYGQLSFTNTGSVGFLGYGNRSLTLQGISSGVLAVQLIDPSASGLGGVLAVVKNGPGYWTLSNSANSYSGGTTINGGVLWLPDFELSDTYLGTAASPTNLRARC